MRIVIISYALCCKAWVFCFYFYKLIDDFVSTYDYLVSLREDRSFKYTFSMIICLTKYPSTLMCLFCILYDRFICNRIDYDLAHW